MTIEQKPELNRFVDPSITEPWRCRWQRLKLFLPIWLYCLAFFLELGLFAGWLASKPSLEILAISIGPCLAVLLVGIVLGEIAMRLDHCSKRVFQFQADTIILGSGKLPRVEWKDVLKIQFEPVADSPNLTKLTLTRLSSRRKRRQRSHALVIENPVEVQELIDFLGKQKAERHANFEIVVLDRPSSPRQVADLFWSMTIFFAGLFLLYNGVPILLVLLNPSHGDSGGGSRFTPEQRAKLAQFGIQHFSNQAEFRHFFLTLGFGLTVIGVALLILGWRLMKRKEPSTVPVKNSRSDWKS